jgi:protein-S-isoprenylcysteine O-methyltransferase Ste14
MRRVSVLVYGVVTYVAFVATFGALLDFAAGTGYVRSIDGSPAAPLASALAIDLALIAVFGVSHSVLARPYVKRVLPSAIERSTYVLVASATLALIVWQWRAIPDAIWVVRAPAARDAIWAFHLAAIALVFYTTFLTDHFDLFGLRQTWFYARGRAYTPVPFVERSLYRRVRHPMMTGFVLRVWTTPAMSLGHLVFAAAMTLYIGIGTGFEERGLLRQLGPVYADYRRRVPAFIPRL